MWRASFRRSVRWGIGLSVAIAIAGCGGSGGGGGGGGSEIAALLGYQPKEGSKSAPLNLGNVEEEGVILHQGTVASGGTPGVGQDLDSYYLVQGIVPGVEYTVTMADLTDDADVYLFQGDPTYTQTPFSRVSLTTSTETFTVQANSNVSSFFISVDGAKTAKGAKYDLSVIVKPQSEGSVAGPVSLFQPPITRSGSTVGYDDSCCGIDNGASGKDSYYQVEVSETVLISLSDMTDDVDLYVYDDEPTFTSPVCASTRLGTAIETCEVSPFATTLYIGVDGSYAQGGAAYKINVIALPVGCGQTVDNPMDEPCDLGGAPGIWTNENTDSFRALAGSGNNGMTVLAGGSSGINLDGSPEPYDSFYVIDPVVAGTAYRLALENATDKVGLYVYDRDSSYKTPVCKPPYDNPRIQECNFTASGAKVYFAVDGSESAAGAAFEVSMMPQFVAEGTAGTPPTPANLGAVPIASGFSNIHTVVKDDDIGISGDKDSYFKVTGTTPGEQYIIAIPGMSDDVDLYVYNGDSTFTTAECVPYQGGDTPEQCIIAATGNEIFFAVDGYFTRAGAAFLVQAQALAGAGEGTSTVPKDLFSANVDYQGYAIGAGDQVYNTDAADSYYQVQVVPGRTYQVSLIGLNEDVDLLVYPNLANIAAEDDPPTVSGCISNITGLSDESCLITPSGGSIYIWVESGWVAQDAIATFRLQVTERELPTPTALTVDATAASVTIDWGSDYGVGGPNDQYFSASVTGGQTYQIRISNLTDDLDLYVFGEDGSFVGYLDCPNAYQYGLGDEYCDYTPGSTGTVYFAVDGAWMYLDYTATFDVSITTVVP